MTATPCISSRTTHPAAVALLISCATAARLLGVGPWAVDKLCRSGELPAGRIGEQWVIAVEDVRDFATTVTRQG